MRSVLQKINFLIPRFGREETLLYVVDGLSLFGFCCFVCRDPRFLIWFASIGVLTYSKRNSPPERSWFFRLHTANARRQTSTSSRFSLFTSLFNNCQCYGLLLIIMMMQDARCKPCPSTINKNPRGGLKKKGTRKKGRDPEKRDFS